MTGVDVYVTVPGETDHSLALELIVSLLSLLSYLKPNEALRWRVSDLRGVDEPSSCGGNVHVFWQSCLVGGRGV